MPMVSAGIDRMPGRPHNGGYRPCLREDCHARTAAPEPELAVSAGPPMAGAEPFELDGGDIGVLLVHGFTGSPQGLRLWGEALAADGLTVSCPLLPGHGTSWADLNRYRWPDWARAARAALDELAGRCHTVVAGGLSFGGAVALHLASLPDARVGGVVVVNPFLYSSDPRIRLLPVLKHLQPAARGVGNDVAEPGRVELAYDRLPLKALDSVRSFQARVTAELPQVRVPVRVYVSPQDHVVEPGNARLVADRVGSDDVELVELARSFHVATLDYDRDVIFAGTRALAERVTRTG
jgi:carboxylesterase